MAPNNQQPVNNSAQSAQGGSAGVYPYAYGNPQQQPQPTPPQQPTAPPPQQPAAPPPQQRPAAPMQPPGYVPQPMMPGQVPPPPPGAKRPPAPQRHNPNSTQNTLQIAEIRDGIVIMNDGSYRSVVMAKSINFDLMSPQERESVEFSYQGFLNSLYFPIQIFVRSTRVDLRPYLQRLDKIRSEHDNMLLALLMEDYLAYMESLAQQTNIMDKKFYVVIPHFPAISAQKSLAQSKNFFSGLAQLFNSKEQRVVITETDLNAAKDELRNRVQAVLGGLQQSGIQALPLDTSELIELYYDTYNPDTATRQQLKNFDDMTAPVVTKGVGDAPQPNLERGMQ
ncbi:hypothetical protein CR970_01080 [Candidatus Saccharibacteria bacterium]|nr:MAG: hypothetical protein CR970_01080 [Candidatus Saccharibacteria bacterium]